MSFGIDQLTDDQLLEILQEACLELGQRDPLVRGLAQQTIFTEAEKVEANKQALKDAVAKVKADYIRIAKEEAYAELKAGVAAGTVKLLTPDEEAYTAVEAGLEARIKLLDEALSGLTGKDGNFVESDFVLRVHQGTVTLAWGGQRSQWRASPSSAGIHELARLIQRAMGSSGPAFGRF